MKCKLWNTVISNATKKNGTSEISGDKNQTTLYSIFNYYAGCFKNVRKILSAHKNKQFSSKFTWSQIKRKGVDGAEVNI